MDGKILPREIGQKASRVHWTAYLGISLCFIAGICLSLDTYLSYVLGLLPLGFAHLSVYLFLACPLPTLILGIVGRYMARKPLWKEGKFLSTLTLVAGCVLLIMELAIVVAELP
ncbi:hypothetical protein [Dictyobacter kobayashii]|uniref:Uncharacterized protein n=1 Tax=Dictyobacter kobayashii TaxID=2014872 RepID=A0A402AGN0_9CHLR|nr:hypothetical protein [Dictyobacter kobayashii]GCE18256.1 hypothetical protein KDK_20560 [Dictyobacter kobayashii]